MIDPGPFLKALSMLLLTTYEKEKCPGYQVYVPKEVPNITVI